MTLDQYLVTFESDLEAIKKEAATELECNIEKELTIEQELDELIVRLRATYERCREECELDDNKIIDKFLDDEIDKLYCYSSKPIALSKINMKLINLIDHVMYPDNHL